MQSHLGSVVWCLVSTAWLGSKFFGAFTRLVGKDVPPLQSVKLIYQPCSRLRAALDPHMINILEDGLKSWNELWWGVYSLIWAGIHLYLLVTRCLIKFDQLKGWHAYNLSLSTIKPVHVKVASFLVWVQHVLTLVIIYCIYTIRTAAQKDDLKTTLKISRSSRRAVHQSTACGEPLSAASLLLKDREGDQRGGEWMGAD